MPSLQLYDHLLRFQLFQGMSRAELLQMAGTTKFGFLKLPAGKPIVKAGDNCRQLTFLVSGQIRLTTQSDDHSYHVAEHLSAPFLLQPDVLFGPYPRYTSTAVTTVPSHFIILSKDEVLRLCDDFLIIRLNLFNLLAQLAQRRGHQPWRRRPTLLRERLIRFFTDHCAYPAGPKTFYVLMTRLADEMGVSRLAVSQQLNALQHDGLLTLHRGRIEIPLLEHLLMNVNR